MAFAEDAFLLSARLESLKSNETVAETPLSRFPSTSTRARLLGMSSGVHRLPQVDTAFVALAHVRGQFR